MKKYEESLYCQGYKNIAGLDEVGRGCWAGPLVVAICVLPTSYCNSKIKDSKKLSVYQRNILFEEIIKVALLVDWIIFEPSYVDEHNPKKTSIIGMEQLINKHQKNIDFCLIDAEKIKQTSIPFLSIIKGDNLSQSIAAASIVAKVIRDREMEKLDHLYPEYKFSKNKGYGTKEHQIALMKNKPIFNVHRFSYKPIKKILDYNNKL